MSTNEKRQHEWEIRISEFKSSGQKMTHWCAANHVDLGQMKYWTRKCKKVVALASPVPSTSFVPLTVMEPTARTSPPSLIVHVGGANIAIQPGFDPQLLRDAVEALSRSC